MAEMRGPGRGHNSEGAIDGESLARDVARVAGLMREQKAIGEDIKEICAAADEAGTCSKRELRRLARESLMDQEVLSAQLERMAALRDALGAFVDTPLGESAVVGIHRRLARDSQIDIEEFTDSEAT